MPIVLLMVRHLNHIVDDLGPNWLFHLYVAFHILAYLLGTIGFILGLTLGMQSPTHGYVGIALICCAMVQALLMIRRPDPFDHKKILIWNVCFFVLTSSLIGLAIYDMVLGFFIHDNDNKSFFKKWKIAYFVIIGVLGLVAVVLEVLSFFTKKRNNGDENSNRGNIVVQTQVDEHNV